MNTKTSTPRTDALIASDTFGPNRAANVADDLASLARTLEREAAQSLEATRLLTQEVTAQAATIATLRYALEMCRYELITLNPRLTQQYRKNVERCIEQTSAALAK